MHNAKSDVPPVEAVTTPALSRLKFNVDLQQLVVLSLFLFSGACGLIYEVLWCRQLGLIYGNTVQSLSAVLTAFMGGLALGSFAAGRLCHRIKRPLFVYGVLELLIGVYCLVLPLIFDSAPLMSFYRSLYGESGSLSLTLLRFLISFVLLVIPTTLMGATLPILTHHLVKSNARLGSTVGRLYSVNSFGAVVGAVAAGFFLLPMIGKVGTNHVAVAFNVILGVLAIAFGFNKRVAVASEPAADVVPNDVSPMPVLETVYSPRLVKLVVLTFGLTGFAAMATQIGWTRAISLGTGSSTYAFSLIVAIFILGLSGGGMVGSWVSQRTKEPAGLLALVLLLIGTLCMALSAALGYGPFLFFILISLGSENYNMVLAAQAAGIGALILAPTFLMGMSLPLTIQIASRSSQNAGRTVGTLYAINTLGSILGSFLCGLVILPALQIQSTLEIMALLYAIPAIVIFFYSESRRQPRALRTMAGILIPLVIMVVVRQPWDRALMSSGLFLLRDKNTQEIVKQGRYLDAYPSFRESEILYYNEGSECTVTVMRTGDDMTLRVGGKPDATAHGDLSTQLCLAMVPEILHPTGAEEVLVIGLGSGVSAGVALAPSTVKRVDIVEMSHEVVEASWWFRSANQLQYEPLRPQSFPGEIVPHWIKTPRVEMIVNDGRNHLLLTNRRYDVIASEPSNPWLAGVGNLFTLEAFQLASSRLKPGGVMCQWLHSYSLEADHVYSVVRTFGQVFKYVQVWNSGPGDYMLVGSDSPLQIPVERLRERMAQPGIKEWLKKVHFDTEEEFLATLLQSDSVRDATAPKAGTKPRTILEISARARLHTDDNMLLEFEAPRALYRQRRVFRSQDFCPLPEKGVQTATLTAQQQADFSTALDLAVAGRQRYRAFREITGKQDEFCNTVSKLAPRQYWLIEEQNKRDGEESKKLLSTQAEKKTDPAEAVRLIEQAQARSAHVRWPSKELIHARIGLIHQLLDEKKASEAQTELEKLNAPANSYIVPYVRARIHFIRNEHSKALKEILEATRLGAPEIDSREMMVGILIADNQPDKALEALRLMLDASPLGANPASVKLWTMRAELLLARTQDKEYEEGLRCIGRAIRYGRSGSEYIAIEVPLLKKLKRFPEMLQALRWRAIVSATAPNIAELCKELIAASERAAQRGDLEESTDLLREARRAGREAVTLHPKDQDGWMNLCRAYLALEKANPEYAAAWQLQAIQSRDSLLQINNGDASKVPADITTRLKRRVVD